MPGVSVVVKGTGKGTETGTNGEYSITAKPGDVIVFSFTGYESHEERVGNETTINYTLQESSSKLNDVVVIGYGTTKRKDLTGSVASFRGSK